MIYISTALLVFVLIITVLSCISDVKSLKIPNWHSLVILVLFVPAWAFSPESFSPLWHHLLSMMLMFIVSYLMFRFGVMGGGDSKLATVLSLWLGIKGLLLFVILMSIAGGVIGGISVFVRKKKPFKNFKEGSWFDVVQAGGNAVPYGVAIATGFWGSVFHTSLLLTLS